MAGFDTKEMMNRAIRYMAEVATQRAAGGWVPPKEQERQQREAMRQEQQHARQVEKQQKDMMRQEQQQARQAEREQQAQQKQFITDEKERQKNLEAFQNGNHPEVPHVVYHGTGSEHDGDFRVPSFFTSDPQGAEWYAKNRGDNPQIFSVHLSMKKPLDTRSKEGIFKLINIAHNAGVHVELKETPKGWQFTSNDISKHSPYEGDNPLDLLYIPKVRNALYQNGHDGVIASDVLSNDEIPTFIPLHSQQIKSATGNQGTFNPSASDITKSEGGPILSKQFPTQYMPNVGRQVMQDGGVPDQPQRQLSPMGFYSAAAERASALQPSGNAVHMINSLRNLHGVKTEELQNAGLIDQSNNVHPDWAGRGKVTRDELVSHLQRQMPQIEERVLGGKQTFDAKRLEQLQNEYSSLKQHPIDDPSFGEDKYDEMIRLMNIRDQSSTDSLYRAAEEAMRNGQIAQRRGDNAAAERYFREHELLNVRAEKLDLQGQGLENPTKYSQYALPGGENYREVLLKLPEQQKKSTEYPVIRPDGLVDGRYDSIQNAARRALEINGSVGDPINTDRVTGFRSPHWSDLNVLAHIRMSDRIGPNGEKILHVEELQSDWGQKGKKSGFKDIAEREYQSAMREHALASRNVGDTFDKLISSGISDNEAYNHPDFLRAIKNEKDAGKRVGDLNLQMKTGLASAPYVTSTEGWTDLALKRVLKEAAEGGYHKVVWTPGEEQAERYDLKNHVSELLYHPDQQALSYADIDGGWIDHPNPVTPEKLPEVIGKEAAQRLLSQTPNSYDGSHRLKGEDLHFGGEGMKGYYDNIVPKRLQAIAKKHDKNAKVGYTDIMLPAAKRKGSNNPPIQAPGIDITPEMRESILRGQSAYKRGGTVSKKHPVLSIAGTHIREEQHGQPIFTGRL